MTAVGNILSIGRDAQALALLGQSVSLARKKKKKAKDFVKVGVTNIVGLSLLRTQAQLASGL